MKKALVLVGLTSCLASPAPAGDTPQVPAGLLACEKIADAAARVRCYDAQVAAMKKATAGASSAAEPAAAAAAPAPTTVVPSAATAAPAASGTAGSSVPSRVGSASTPPTQPAAARQDASPAQFGEEELPLSQRPQVSRGAQTLRSSITAIGKASQGMYYFSLANGQIWRADNAETSQGFPLALLFHTGAAICIERGALGSYHMWMPQAGAKNWTYVTRIR